MSSTWKAARSPCSAGYALLRTAAGMSSAGTLVLWSAAWLVTVQPAAAHPQCLDFEPPFKPPWHLEFCTQYQEFGCCDQKADNTIAERYWDIIELLERAGDELCEAMLKEILCQV